MPNHSFQKGFLLFFFFLFSFSTYAIGDAARQEAKINQVYAQYSLSGKGTIIAMIDRGIDYTHPDFINANGQTRIAYIFDMIDNTGANAPNNPYGVGTIFSAADINSALQVGGAPLTTDRFGHGTATTGIICGDGSGTPDGKFRGVAYEAMIISVKVTHDFFPPFGNQLGQAGAFNPANISIALQFVADKLEEMGLPGVTLMNIGSVGGPTDGTSSICRAMDAFVDRGHTLVCGVGDDGGAANHAAGNVGMGQSVELRINKAAGNLRFDLWYSEEDRFNITIERPNGQKLGPFNGPSGANGVDDRSFTDIFYYHRGSNVEFYGATSPRREILIDFTGSAGIYKVTLTGAAIGGAGEFNATLNPSRYNLTNHFLNNVVAGYSLNDYTSAKKVISPSDYVIKNDWFDINGVFRDITGQGETGEIWVGSSVGPTMDQRLGIDFSAPGEVLFCAYSPNTWYSNATFNLVQGGNGLYGIQSAVSAAAPLSTGVIALMLQLKPDLSPQMIKDILNQTARQDAFTGTVPNNNWGHGKLDALAAIQAVNSLVAINEPVYDPSTLKVFPNPSSIGAIHFEIPASISNPQRVFIVNALGRVVYQLTEMEVFTQEVSLDHLPKGTYFIIAEGQQRRITEKVILL